MSIADRTDIADETAADGARTDAQAPGSHASSASPAPRRVPWLALMPLAVFLALAGLFAVQLFSGRDASELPSVLVGRAPPALDLPRLTGPVEADGLALPSPAAPEPSGRVTLVNFWASWCAPCVAEHPVLASLAERPDVSLKGVAYKDVPEASLGFLARLGDPFEAAVSDRDGRASLDWGVTGVPETFVLAPDGRVVYRHLGPITDAAAFARVEAAIDEAASGMAR